MSGRLSIILDSIKSLLFYSYSSLGVSEMRGSGAESFLPPNLQTSWLDLFGTPYYQTIPTGGETLATGGVADIGGNNKLRVETRLDCLTGASGNILIKFAVGNDPYNLGIHEVDASLNITVASVSDTLVETYTILTVGNWRYIKAYSVTHSVGSDVGVEIRLYNAGFPVIM